MYDDDTFPGTVVSAVCRGPEGCRRKFLKFFPGGFGDETYISWEREYKCNAHLRWVETLDASRGCAR